MSQFKFIISADKWPSEYNVTASNWATGAARAIKEWKKKAGKGSRTDKMSIQGFKIKI